MVSTWSTILSYSCVRRHGLVSEVSVLDKMINVIHIHSYPYLFFNFYKFYASLIQQKNNPFKFYFVIHTSHITLHSKNKSCRMWTACPHIYISWQLNDFNHTYYNVVLVLKFLFLTKIYILSFSNFF